MSFFETMPHEINRHIGSFLDPSSQVNFNRVLSHAQDRTSRKIPKFVLRCFEINIWVDHIKNLIADSEKRSGNARVVKLIRLMNFMAQTRWPVEKYPEKFRLAVLRKAQELRDLPIERQNSQSIRPFLRKKLIFKCNQVVKRYTNVLDSTFQSGPLHRIREIGLWTFLDEFRLTRVFEL